MFVSHSSQAQHLLLPGWNPTPQFSELWTYSYCINKGHLSCPQETAQIARPRSDQ
ncbi:mCG1036209 [Mus musculus]|nr:mCG1036209 [Mus musculus]